MGAAGDGGFSPVGWFADFDARVEAAILAVAVLALGALLVYERFEKRHAA